MTKNYMYLLQQGLILEECGTGNVITFSIINDEDNTAMLDLNGVMFKNVHLYSKLDFTDDGLILINGRAFEAFEKIKVNLK